MCPLCRSLNDSSEANGSEPTLTVVEDDVMVVEDDAPKGDDQENIGKELGCFENLDINLEAMEGEEKSSPSMSPEVNSEELEEDREQGQQPEPRISCKDAAFAFTDYRFKQYAMGQISNPLFSRLKVAGVATSTNSGCRGGDAMAEEEKGSQGSGEVANGEAGLLSSVSSTQGTTGAPVSDLTSEWRESAECNNNLGEGGSLGDSFHSCEDEGVVGKKLGGVEGCNEGNSNSKKSFLTPEQVAAIAEKKRRKKLRQKANRAAKKQAEQLALSLKDKLEVSLVQVTPEQPSKAVKRSAEVPLSRQVKVPKLETLPSAGILARYLSQSYELAHLHKGAINPIFWLGPIELANLRDVAHSYSAHKEGAFEETISLGLPGCSLRDEQGLLLLALRSTESTPTVSPAQASREERSGEELAPLVFHSSELLSQGQRIAHGNKYRCIQCQSSHFPPSKSKTVLVTGSEVIAAAALPHILTLPDSGAVVTPSVAPHQCWDRVWVLGGMRADPYKVLKGIYGTYRGSLKILLDMGTLPVVHGESASSVITRLNVLVADLKKSLRLWALGSTQVIVLPPILYLGEGSLALHQSPAARTYSKLALAQLISLKQYIDSRNSDLLRGMTRSPIHQWANLASHNTSEMAEDSMDRIVEKVQVTGNSSVVVDGGYLHLKPDSLTSFMRGLVSFVGANAWASW